MNYAAWSVNSSMTKPLIPAIAQRCEEAKSLRVRHIDARIYLAAATLGSFGDGAIHAAATVVKMVIAVTHLPACIVWSGARPRVLAQESLAHADKAIRFLVAAFLTLPVQLNPNWAPKAFSWLRLYQADGLLQNIQRLWSSTWGRMSRRHRILALTVTATTLFTLFRLTGSQAAHRVHLPMSNFWNDVIVAGGLFTGMAILAATWRTMPVAKSSTASAPAVVVVSTTGTSGPKKLPQPIAITSAPKPHIAKKDVEKSRKIRKLSQMTVERTAKKKERALKRCEGKLFEGLQKALQASQISKFWSGTQRGALYDEALKCLEGALMIAPDGDLHNKILCFNAVIFFQSLDSDELKETIKDYEEILAYEKSNNELGLLKKKLDPDDLVPPQTWLGLAKFYYDDGNLNEGNRCILEFNDFFREEPYYKEVMNFAFGEKKAKELMELRD